MINLGKNRNRTDQEIVEGIKNGGREEDICLKQLYKDNLRPIMSFVLSNKGTEIEAKEMLQEAIIVLYEKIKENEFDLKAKLSTFIFSIVKNQWYTHLKKGDKLVYAEPSESEENVYYMNSHDVADDEKSKLQFVKTLLEQLKEDCKEIIVLSVYQKYTMQEIAEIMGFKNEQIARNKKSKCLGYFKKLILSDDKAKKIFASS